MFRNVAIACLAFAGLASANPVGTKVSSIAVCTGNYTTSPQILADTFTASVGLFLCAAGGLPNTAKPVGVLSYICGASHSGQIGGLPSDGQTGLGLCEQVFQIGACTIGQSGPVNPDFTPNGRGLWTVQTAPTKPIPKNCPKAEYIAGYTYSEVSAGAPFLFEQYTINFVKPLPLSKTPLAGF